MDEATAVASDHLAAEWEAHPSLANTARHSRGRQQSRQCLQQNSSCIVHRHAHGVIVHTNDSGRLRFFGVSVLHTYGCGGVLGGSAAHLLSEHAETVVEICSGIDGDRLHALRALVHDDEVAMLYCSGAAAVGGYLAVGSRR